MDGRLGGYTDGEASGWMDMIGGQTDEWVAGWMEKRGGWMEKMGRWTDAWVSAQSGGKQMVRWVDRCNG